MKKIVCNSCGTKNNGKSTFCSKCGADLSTQRNEFFNIEETAENNSTAVSKSSKIKIPIIIICAVLVLAGIIFAILKFLPANGSGTKSYEVNMFNDGLVPFRSGEKYGYLDINGDIAINPQFDSVSDFSEGLACIGVKNGDDMKYGYIDTSGNYIVDAQYDDALDFVDSIALVRSGDYVGVIDKEGNYVMNPQYDSFDIKYIGNGMFLIADGNGDYANLTDMSGNKISETRFDSDYLYYVNSNTSVRELKMSDSDLIPLETVSGKYCYIDSKGKTVIDAQFDSANYFHEGLARIGIKQGSGDDTKTKYGYIDRSGNIVINPQFDSAYDFSEGMACVGMHNSKSDYANLYGYIDKNGKYVINTQYDSAGSFQNGCAIVRKDEDDDDSGTTRKFGLIDKDGNIIMEIKNDMVNNNYNSGYVLFEFDEKYGYANYDGEVIISNEYDIASPFYSDGYAVVSTVNKTFTVIDKNGEQLWGKEFDGVGTLSLGNTLTDGLDYKFCKADGCYNSTYSGSDEGYCLDHYNEFEKKPKTSSKSEIVGNWSSLIVSCELNCYDDNLAFLTLNGSIYMGSWSYRSDGTYDLDMEGVKMTAYVHSSYLNLYLGTTSVTLYKD